MTDPASEPSALALALQHAAQRATATTAERQATADDVATSGASPVRAALMRAAGHAARR